MTNETRKAIDEFIFEALHDPERREVLLALLAQAGFPEAGQQTACE